jgi:hypothetical protein
LLYVWKESGRYHITAQVRDEEGHLVVEVEDNHWRTTSYAGDKNYDDTALEVKDSKGRIILQLSLMPDCAAIQARMMSGYGQEVEMSALNPGGLADVGIRPNNEHPLKEPIRPIFRYPSKQRWEQHTSTVENDCLGAIQPKASSWIYK